MKLLYEMPDKRTCNKRIFRLTNITASQCITICTDYVYCTVSNSLRITETHTLDLTPRNKFKLRSLIRSTNVAHIACSCWMQTFVSEKPVRLAPIALQWLYPCNAFTSCVFSMSELRNAIYKRVTRSRRKGVISRRALETPPYNVNPLPHGLQVKNCDEIRCADRRHCAVEG